MSSKNVVVDSYVDDSQSGGTARNSAKFVSNRRRRKTTTTTTGTSSSFLLPMSSLPGFSVQDNAADNEAHSSLDAWFLKWDRFIGVGLIEAKK